MTFAELIEQQLASTSLSAAALAEQMGVSDACVNNWRGGRSLPPTTKIRTYAAQLAIGEDELRAIVEADRAKRDALALTN